MEYVVICATALAAAVLTFFSSFGLGTLLMPAFALFFPVDRAIILTAIVHFLNGLFKLALVGRNADRGVVLRFGVPALVAAFVGAWLLTWLADLPDVFSYQLGARTFHVTPIKLLIGVLLAGFTLLEALPRFRELTFEPKYLPLGGVISGFFGGLSGHQGALRSAFLTKAGLSKEAFIGTGVVLACMVDIARLGQYLRDLSAHHQTLDWGLLAAAVAAALTGTVIGNLALKKLTMSVIQHIVTALLIVISIGLLSGLL